MKISQNLSEIATACSKTFFFSFRAHTHFQYFFNQTYYNRISNVIDYTKNDSVFYI